jgi:hypothetical protein
MTMTTSLAFLAARHSSDSPDWNTPADVVEAARLVLGGIDLDPMSDTDANRIVQAINYFTVDDDGLRQPWAGRVFLNPPGGRVSAAWCKLTTEPAVEAFIWIGYSREQLQTLQGSGAVDTPLDYHLCIPCRRIAFLEPPAKRAARLERLRAAGKRAKDNSPSHANYICYRGPHPDRFARVFRAHGQVIRAQERLRCEA